ncbi:MAG: hypothetical protein AAGF79_02525, partial [Pseudomonadota bacterium]
MHIHHAQRREPLGSGDHQDAEPDRPRSGGLGVHATGTQTAFGPASGAGPVGGHRSPGRLGDQARRPARNITINGKFLQGDLIGNGVHRVALNFSAELIRRATETIPTRLMAPAVADKASVDALGLDPELRPGRWGKGQAWEMVSLPSQTRQDLLVNFCNLGPVLHPNSVVMIHDVQTLTEPDAYPARQVAGYRLLWPLIARRARAILTVSEHSRQALAAHEIAPLDRILVVHNGTDHILRHAPSRDVVARLGLGDRRFALAIGGLAKYKNMRTLFQAFSDPGLADVPLVLTGSANRADYEAKGWTPPPNTIFAGRVSDPDLRMLPTHSA